MLQASHVRLLVFAASLLIGLQSGCSKDKHDSATNSGSNSGQLGKHVNAGRIIAQYKCTSDADCRVSCDRPGDCCGQGCECTGAYHKDQLRDMQAKNRESCAKSDYYCREYDCDKPTHDVEPECQEGLCTAVRVPRAAAAAAMPPVDRTCTSDDECVAMYTQYIDDDACCWSCTTDAVSKSWFEAATPICSKMGLKGCPKKKCSDLQPVTCSTGSCVVSP